MKRILIPILSLFSSSLLLGQGVNTPLLDWSSTTGSQNFFYKTLTKTDASGNIYIAGATVNGSGNRDLLLAKYNSSGALQWMQQYDGGANGEDFATALVIDGSSNVYITGAVTTNTTTMFPDLVTAKYNSSGTLQWMQTYDGTGHTYDAGADITLDGSNNVYVTGSGYNSTPNADFITIKYNNSGTQLWATQNDGNPHMNDAGVKVTVDATSVSVAGAIQNGTNSYKLGLVKYAIATGSVTGTTLTNTLSTSVDQISGGVQDAAGNIYLSGSIPVTGHGYDYYVIKLSSTLAVLWQQTYNGSASLDDYSAGIALDASGNVYVTGYSKTTSNGRDMLTVKYNSSGTQQWVTSYDDALHRDDEGTDLKVDASGNIVVTGYCGTTSGKDYYTVKYNSSGTKIWDITTDYNATEDKATNIATDLSGNIIVTGAAQTGANSYTYFTVRYVEKSVITPTDFNLENVSEKFWYYTNKGQLRDINDSLVPDVLFTSDLTTPKFFVKNKSMSYIFARVDSVASTVDTMQRIDATFTGAQATKTYALEKQDFGINYFLGTNRNFSQVFAQAKLVTPEIYPNIDLMYSSNQNGWKYYWIIKPGGDIRNIQYQFTGASSYSLDATTNALSLNTPYGKVTFDRPTAYQLTAANATVAVTGWTPDWTSNGGTNKYKFNTGSYTTSLTLVIQVDQGNGTFSPTSNGNLVWNSYFGGDNNDNFERVKVDRYGNIYALMTTMSQNFFAPNTSQTTSPVLNNWGSILLKFNSTGTRKKQNYVSSNSGVMTKGLAIIKDSAVVIAGSNSGTNLSGPSSGSNPAGAYVGSTGPSYIMKFDSTLNNIAWSTHFPGSIYDADAKKNGDLYLVGHSPTSIVYLKTQPGALNLNASNLTQNYGGIISKFDKNGVPLWSTFSSAFESNNIVRVKVDTATNNVFVFGAMNGVGDFHMFNKYNTFLQNTSRGVEDGFIQQYDNHDTLAVSTLYSGNHADQFYDMTILANGDFCLVGSSYSDTAGVLYNPANGSYFSTTHTNYALNPVGLIVKFNWRFIRTWATFYGDTLHLTQFRGAATDCKNSNLLIGGKSDGLQTLSFPSYYNKTVDPSSDHIFLEFDASNHRNWVTAMGANSSSERGTTSIAFNPKNNNLVFVGASGANSGYPWQNFTTPQAYWQNTNFGQGLEEGTVGRFDVVYITGISELSPKSIETNDLLLYPNPAKDYTDLKFKQGLNGRTNITVYNMMGQIMESKSYNNIDPGTVIQLNTSQYCEGVYFVNISNGTSSKSIKFITFK